MNPWEDDDDEYDDGNGAAATQMGETGKVISKLYNDGYRIGKAAKDEKEIQRGFDDGFARGMQISRIFGRLYGRIRMSTKDTVILEQVERFLFATIPENDAKVSLVHIQHLGTLVTPLSNLPSDIHQATSIDHTNRIDAWWAEFQREIEPFVENDVHYSRTIDT